MLSAAALRPNSSDGDIQGMSAVSSGARLKRGADDMGIHLGSDAGNGMRETTASRIATESAALNLVSVPLVDGQFLDYQSNPMPVDEEWFESDDFAIDMELCGRVNDSLRVAVDDGDARVHAVEDTVGDGFWFLDGI